jgi:hypothetical protein
MRDIPLTAGAFVDREEARVDDPNVDDDVDAAV